MGGEERTGRCKIEEHFIPVLSVGFRPVHTTLLYIMYMLATYATLYATHYMLEKDARRKDKFPHV